MTALAGRGPAGVVVTHRRARRATGHRATLLLRCGLYLGPVAAALAGAGTLARLPWPVPAAALLLGWAAAQALTYAGAVTARRAGLRAAVRLVAGGFVAAATGWSVAVATLPAGIVGAEPMVAAATGTAVLAAFLTITAALVGRTEAEVVRWNLPVWLLGGAAAAGLWPAAVPLAPLLAVLLAAAAIPALRPAFGDPSGPTGPTLTSADVRRTTGYLLLGAGQAVAVIWVWRLSPEGTPPAGLVPLMLAVPVLEAFVGWHAAQVRAGLDACETVRAYARHLRCVAAVTVAGLLPPLAVGVALAAAAHRMPYGFAGHRPTAAVVLALAAGTLLSGVFASTLLLAVRGRLGRAAGIAVAAPAAGAVAVWLGGDVAAASHPSVAVAALAVTLVAGIAAVAYTALDHRRTP